MPSYLARYSKLETYVSLIDIIVQQGGVKANLLEYSGMT